jgi:putative Holliday junction resolvase
LGRILAIDYGTKRVGLAVTDPLQIIATPLDTIHSAKLIAFLKGYLAQEPVEAFVLGLPMRLDGTDTNNTVHVKQFNKLLVKNFPDHPVYLVDERFTSSIALDTLIAAGTTKKYRRDKGNIDKVSAVLILQTYMARSKSGAPLNANESPKKP